MVRVHPSDPEPERREIEPPAPLRKAKQDKATDTESPTAQPPAAIPIAPTPMRAAATPQTDTPRQATRTFDGEGPRPSREELPDSDERGEP
jgi:hypothetical protein